MVEKPDTETTSPFSQNWADGGHKHPPPLEEGVREICLEEGTLELGFTGCEMEEEGRAFQTGGIACAKPMGLQ